MDDGIKSLPYGHYKVRDEPALREIEDDPDWGNDDVPNENIETSSSSTQPCHSHGNLNQYVSDDSWMPPDPGLARSPVNESDLDDNDLWNFELTDDISPQNSFVLFEADDSDSDYSYSRGEKVPRLI